MLFSGVDVITDASGSARIERNSDLMEWDPASGTWTRCGGGPDVPAPRTDAAMAYDPARHALVLFGGTAYDAQGNTMGAVEDVWEWALP